MGLTIGGIGSVFGPKIIAVTECGADELQSTDLMNQYLLRVLFQSHPTSSAREFTLQLLLRSEMASMEYSAGRYSLSEFVSAPTTKTHSYFHAVYHFSASIGQAWQFFDLNRTKTRHRTGAQIDFFKPNDASVLEKLNVIYNKSKHTVADYESIHQPLWITNRGIATDSMELTFHDLREILEQMSTWCRMFLDPDRQHGRSNSIEE